MVDSTWCMYCGKNLPPEKIAAGDHYCNNRHRREDRIETVPLRIVVRATSIFAGGPPPVVVQASPPPRLLVSAPVRMLQELRQTRIDGYARLPAETKLLVTNVFIHYGYVGKTWPTGSVGI